MPAHFSRFSQNTLENYAFINQAVQDAMQEFLDGQEMELIKQDAPSLDVSCRNFCMARPTKYDLVLKGKKIAGAAQRKTKEGFLHQGTISLMQPPIEYLEDLLLPNTKVVEAMRTHTFFLLPKESNKKQLDEARMQLRHQLKQSLEKYV